MILFLTCLTSLDFPKFSLNFPTNFMEGPGPSLFSALDVTQALLPINSILWHTMDIYWERSGLFSIKNNTRCNARLSSPIQHGWFNNITAWTGLTVAHLTRKAEDRQQWRMVVYNVTKPRSEDGWRQDMLPNFDGHRANVVHY